METVENANKRRNFLSVSVGNSGEEATFDSTIVKTEPGAPLKPQHQKITCQVCSKQISQRGFGTHLKRHLEGNPRKFECPHCERKFTKKSELNDHVKTVHEGVRFKCTFPDCGKVFSWRRSLQYHARQHDGEYKHMCEICNRGFFSNDFYTSHMNAHYGIKAFECGLCGKKYATTSNLSRHLRSCGNEKTEPCPYCDKFYAGETELKAHIKGSHTGQKRRKHLCTVCGKTYCDLRRLRGHMAKHEEEDKKEEQTEEIHVITTTVDISQLDVIENVNIIEM